MKSILFIQLKAAFLLIVFSLNTVIGFACAIGINMGYNTKDHHGDEVTEAAIPLHSDGKNYDHNEAENRCHEAANHKSGDDKDNCCKDIVTKLSQIDKAIAQSSAINPVFFTPFVSSIYNIDILVASQVSRSTKYFVRGHHPPIPDILIAIQRFQI